MFEDAILIPAVVGVLVMTVLVAVLLALWRRQRMKLERLTKEHEEFEVEESRLFDFLHQLGESLYVDQPIQKIQERIVEGVGSVVEAGGGALYMLDRTGAALVPVYQSDDCPPLIAVPEEVMSQHKKNAKAVSSFVKLQRVLPGEGLVGGYFEKKAPVSIMRIDREPELRGDGACMTSQRERGAMVATLLYGKKPLGVLSVVTQGPNHAFTEHDFDVFKSAAEQSAFAIGSALVHQEVLDKRKMEDELRSARDIQKVLLPSKAPEFEGWNFAGTNLPASVVSGDYYDYISVDRDHQGVVIADVSGKGIPASLVMATCRALVRMNARQQFSPSGMLKKVNRLIFGDIREDMFISMAYCILTNKGEVSLARAGHDPPLLYRRATGKVERLKPPGLAVGVDSGKVFDRVTKNQSVSMSPGDCLLLYTDGATDAMDATGLDEFTIDKLEVCFASAAASGAAHTIEQLTGQLRDFMGSHKQMDDITLIAMEKR